MAIVGAEIQSLRRIHDRVDYAALTRLSNGRIATTLSGGRIFQGLKDGTLEPKQAIEMNNCAGKMINSARLQMDYAELREE